MNVDYKDFLKYLFYIKNYLDSNNYLYKDKFFLKIQTITIIENLDVLLEVYTVDKSTNYNNLYNYRISFKTESQVGFKSSTIINSFLEIFYEDDLMCYFSRELYSFEDELRIYFLHNIILSDSFKRKYKVEKILI